MAHKTGQVLRAVPFPAWARQQASAARRLIHSGRAHNGAAVMASLGGRTRGITGQQKKLDGSSRHFHATPAARQGNNMWNERPWHFGVVVVPQQMAYVGE